ncbi:MAG TPA: hypothetical protein VMY42_13950 [Thermoguttaceae bacterium]|nr:hypothetical protein [Thermoguttaceae bacterium]
MPNATLERKPPVRSVALHEINAISAPAAGGRVDAEAGVIRGVKVLGLQSGNTGRTIGLDAEEFGPAVDQRYAYTIEALRDATGLYEGIGVYVDHPQFAFDANGSRRAIAQDRKTADRFGRLVNVRVTETGMYADLEYLKSHPLAAQVVEVAQRMPEALALSHNATGRPVKRDGRVVIEKILAVRSVDLVGEKAGTTRSLFETETEEPIMDGDMGVEAPAAVEANPGESVKAGFREAVLSVLDSDADKKDKISKIKALLDAEEKATAALEGKEATAGGEGDKKDEGEKKTETPESLAKTIQPAPGGTVENLRRQLAEAEAREKARELLESAGVPTDKARVEAVAMLPDEVRRKALIETWKQPAGKEKPRSTPARLAESQAEESGPYDDLQGTAALLLQR